MSRIVIDARKIRDLGIGTHIQGLLGQLPSVDAQHEYSVLVPDAADFAGTSRFRAVPCSAPKYSLRELWSLPALIRGQGAALFHSPHYVLPPRLPCPAVVTIHDLIHLRFPELLATPLHRFYARWMLRSCTRRAKGILTVSQHSKQDLVRMLGVREDRIRVVGNGIGPEFRPVLDRAELDRLRARHGLPARFVLCVGNINPHKNVLRLLEAWPQVADKLDLDLVLVGNSVRRDPRVQAIRAAIAATARVRHIPHVPLSELPGFYTLARLFVTPSLYEGFGLTPLEAMACGTPVAAARTSSLPEVLGEAAVWFDPTQPDEIAEQLIRLAQDQPLREELVDRGHRQAARYTWESVARQTLAAYQEALVPA